MGDATTKKKIKPGAIEVHPEDTAIVVNYEVQEVAKQPDGSTQIVGREQAHKKIPVKSLDASSNTAAIAQDVVDKCKLIHPSKVGFVDGLLQQLQQRVGGTGGGGGGGGDGGGAAVTTAAGNAAPPPQTERYTRPPKEDKPEKQEHKSRSKRTLKPGDPGRVQEDAAELRSRQQHAASQIFKTQQKQYEPAYLKDLERYIEELYEEDMSVKVKATGMIAQLFRHTENFEHLLMHSTLLQTLARMMREEMKRSMYLCINIISVFFSISNFSQFHQIIMDNQMGALTMDLIELEIKRTEHRAAEEGIVPAVVAQKALDAASGKVTLQDREKKMLSLIQTQDRLLYLSFYMLLNLAEDVGVERKMKKKNIVVYLVKMLDRSNVELLILAITFLKKLSIYKENKEKMAECKIVDKLAKFVPVRNDVLLMSVLRLLHNLSFDAPLRDAMVRNGLVPKLVEMMTLARFQPVVLGLLYHISIDDKFKSLFTYTECIPRIYEMLMRVTDLRNTPELIALAVNLTQNGRNAEVMCEGDRFDRLIRRAFQTCDELAFKVIRNLAQQESLAVRRRFGPYIEQLVLLLKAPEITAELFVEVLGCLANLYLPEFDFFTLVRKHDLLHFLATYAQPGAVDDDILLEVVMFVGVLCNEGTAPLLVESGLVNTLFALMGEKKEDDEFVLQIAFAFNKLMVYDSTRNALLGSTQVVFYLVDLLQDKNKEVRRVADQCLDVIMDTDEEWAVRIRNLKFESFNQEWLDVVSTPTGQVMGVGVGYDGIQQPLIYNAADDTMDYGLGAERVVTDLEDINEALEPQWATHGVLQAGELGAEEGSYDEGEMVRGYV